MNGPQGGKAIEGRLQRFDTLLQEINSAADPAIQDKVEELIRVLMELHSAGLERMLDLLWNSSPEGQNLIDNLLAQDGLVSGLLLLHGLHPLDFETRIRQALEKVRPYMNSHGGNVELLGATNEGVVRLRLEGTCHGCPSSRVTLKFAVEKAIYEAAPDTVSIEVEGALESQPLSTAPVRLKGDEWVEVEGLASLKSEGIRTLKVSGVPILFCRVAGTFYAYGSTCPKCGQLLGQAKLAGADLVCFECGHRFDILRAGRDLDEPALHLRPMPLLEERGQIRVALPANGPVTFLG